MDETQVQKSLLDKILDQTFTSIAEDDAFDEETVQELRRLAENREMVKRSKVFEALTLGSGASDETA